MEFDPYKIWNIFKSTEMTVPEFQKLLDQRKKECNREGHKDADWDDIRKPQYDNASKLEGVCNYCMTHLERTLADSEAEKAGKEYDPRPAKWYSFLWYKIW